MRQVDGGGAGGQGRGARSHHACAGPRGKAREHSVLPGCFHVLPAQDELLLRGRLILKVLGFGSTEDLDPNTDIKARHFLLAALIADEQLDDAGLDAFMDEARKLADQWLA